MRGRPFRFEEFAGVNLRDASLTDSKQARDALNVTTRGRGITRRGGSVLLNAHGDMNVFAAVMDLGGGTPVIVSSKHDGTNTVVKAYKVDGTVLATYNQATAGPLPVEWIAAPGIGGQGPLYGVIDGSFPIQFTGSAFAAWTASVGSLPVGKYLTFHANRVFVAGVAATPDTLYASDVGNPRDWDTTDGGSWAVKFDPFDGQNIRGIATAGEQVLVFKESSTHVVYDLETGANRRLSDGIGCVSHRSIAESPYGTFFLGRDGVWITDGSRLELVSDDVEPLLKAVAPDARGRAAGRWHDGRYYLSVEVQRDETHVVGRTLEYDPKRKTWWIHSCHSWQWAAVSIAPFAPETLIGVASSSISTPGTGSSRPTFDRDRFPVAGVYRAFVAGVNTDGTPPVDVELDDPTLFRSMWASSWLVLGADLRKRVRAIEAWISGSATLLKQTDFEPPEVELQLLNGADYPSENRVLNPGVARAWSLVLRAGTNFNGPEPFTLDSYTLYVDVRRD